MVRIFTSSTYSHVDEQLYSFLETGSKLKVGLPQECRETCVCAVSKMQQVCSELVSGEITMKELQKIKDNLEPMHRLCAAATYQRRRSEKAAVSSALCQRLEEFEMFEKHRVRLCHLCNELHIGIQGMYMYILY